MAISANSIVHYTSSLNVLKAILKGGFKIKYCQEEILTLKEKKFHGAFPMVSFCDIPLSDVHKHVDSYGYYGLGLSKNWAFEKGLNPVFYIERNSVIGLRLRESGERMSKNKNIEDEFKDDLVNTIAYSKNYQGLLQRSNGEVKKDYIFYNEREWRYVPSQDDLNKLGASLVVSTYNYKTDKNKYNNQLKSQLLTFQPDDIAYIIVNKKAEIPEMVDHIRSIYKKKCSSEELDITFTKVISVEQIKEDF